MHDQIGRLVRDRTRSVLSPVGVAAATDPSGDNVDAADVCGQILQVDGHEVALADDVWSQLSSEQLNKDRPKQAGRFSYDLIKIGITTYEVIHRPLCGSRSLAYDIYLRVP